RLDLEEAALLQRGAGGGDVFVHRPGALLPASVLRLEGGNQARPRLEQGAHPVPVALLAGGARDHVVERRDDRVFGGDIGGVGGGLGGGRRGRRGLVAERCGGDGRDEERQRQDQVSQCHGSQM